VKISRRRFFLGAAASSLAVVGLGVRAWPENIIARIVRDRIPDVQIRASDMQSFVNNVIDHEDNLKISLLVFKDIPSAMRGALPKTFRKQLQKLEDRIATNFLMGTDYFSSDRDPGTVTFIAYPDPYDQGCANPLARFDFPTERGA
jgi:hypothetical protein